MLDFEAIFQAHSDATEKTWGHDRKKTVGASEVFGCLRQAWFKKRAGEFTETRVDGTIDRLYPEDDDVNESWGARKRGDLLEAHYVVPAVQNHLNVGELLFAGNDQETLFHKHNSATPDGLITDLPRNALKKYGVADIETDSIVLEIKSIDPRVNLRGEAKPIHVGQTQTQLGIIRETTGHKPVYGVILYVDASFLDKVKVFTVKFDPAMWEAAQKRAKMVFTIDDPSEIMPEGRIDGDCEFCPFQESCAIVTAASIPGADKVSKADRDRFAADFDPLLDDLRQATRAKDDAEHAVETLKQKIRDKLREIGVRKMSPNDKRWSVSWYGQPGRESLDKVSIAEALGDLEPYTKRGKPFDVLRVTFPD